MISLSIVLLFVIGTLVIVQLFKRPKKAPPGPNGIPFIGNLLQFRGDPMGTLLKWSKEYGPILHLKICGYKLILLNDAKCAREMFSQNAFIGKPVHVILTSFSKGAWGVISTEGETWEAHRRFTLKGLRDFGFSKSSMEGLIMEEISVTLNVFKENDGKTLSVGTGFNMSVSNSLWTIVNGQRSNQEEDSKIYEIMHDVLRTVNTIFRRGVFIFPWLRHVVPEWSGYNEFMANIEGMQTFVLKAVKEHVKNFIENSPRDFIDLYLEEIKKAAPGSPFYGEVGQRHMIATITDLFLAGNDTTATTLTWAVLYLCRHPMAQDTLYQEICLVVGENRKPMLSDRPNMPFTEAVIMEVLRKSTLLPFGVPHRAVRDEEFQGYLIEKDTIILTHLRFIMNNPDVFGDPENFRPERFLSEDKSTILKNDNFIPFQTGKRQCLGEGLARDTLFLFIASIFQQFEILPDPENPKPELLPVLGFINGPKPFKVLLRHRKH